MARRIIHSRRGRIPVSGKQAALLLAFCFLVSAILIPFTIRLPRWIEVEAVLAAWWLVWAIAISVILHRGCEVTDDHSTPSDGSGLDDAVDPGGCIPEMTWTPDESCGTALGWMLIVPLVILGLTLIVELLIPAIAFAAYFTIRGMLAWAVNDRHHCAGSWPRSILWGALSAALFTAPLALLVWAVHQRIG